MGGYPKFSGAKIHLLCEVRRREEGGEGRGHAHLYEPLNDSILFVPRYHWCSLDHFFVRAYSYDLYLVPIGWTKALSSCDMANHTLKLRCPQA